MCGNNESMTIKPIRNDDDLKRAFKSACTTA